MRYYISEGSVSRGSNRATRKYEASHLEAGDAGRNADRRCGI
jgi:hypothetical protein